MNEAMNRKVQEYLANAKNWQAEMILLRNLLLDCGLVEDLKWGKPCYSLNNRNIVIIQAFKDHCDLGFFNGSSLKDAKGLLVKAGEHTQAARQMRFTNTQEIENIKGIITAYIKEASALKETALTTTVPTKMGWIAELEQVFLKNSAFQKAFEALTPGRQRAYLIYFSAAKQSQTRVARIESYTHKIFCGKGIHDCDCGLSKRMPNCDGSHKILKK